MENIKILDSYKLEKEINEHLINQHPKILRPLMKYASNDNFIYYITLLNIMIFALSQTI